MKIIPKAQYGTQLVAQSDNTRVSKPLIEKKIQYKLKPGEVFFTDNKTKKRILIKPKNEVVRADTRNSYQKQRDNQEYKVTKYKYQQQRNQEEAGKTIEAVGKLISPSTYVGPLFRNNDKSYIDNVMSGEGAGNNVANTIIDTVIPGIQVQGYRIGKQLFNPANRAAHAYVNISPSGYDNVKHRAVSWIKDILKGNNADIEHPKWGMSELGEELKSYIPETVHNRELIASQTRDDAWRIYNGLKPKYNMYIKNSDGTYSYNMDKINEMSRGTFKPVTDMYSNPFDYVTGAGGGLTKYENKNLATQGLKTYGIQTIEDVWDLHPFSRPSDLISKRIPIIEKPFKTYNRMAVTLSSKIKKVSNNLKYNNKDIKNYLSNADEYTVETFDPEMFPRNNLSYNVGEKLDKIAKSIQPSKQPWEYKPAQKINNYGKTLEAGKILGGKPFKMRTEIPYTQFEKKLDNPIEVDTQKSIPIKIVGLTDTGYGFIPNEGMLLPTKVLRYKHGIPDLDKFTVNNDVINLDKFMINKDITNYQSKQ